MPIDIQAKSILNKTRRRDPWFLDDYTVNPYSGCSFNCLYCYIRGSKYGIHMEEKLGIKENAVDLLRKALNLRAKKNQYGIIVLSSATDPYLHFEKEYLLTRRLLEVIAEYKFPVHIITKSDLVLRDLDLLKKINADAILPPDLADKLQHKALVTFSFSTVDDSIASIFEPGATPPSTRLKILDEVAKQGFKTGVSMMPLIPYVTDTGAHLQQMFESFKQSGAQYVFPATITLFGTDTSDSKTLVLRAINKHYPHLFEKYQQLFATSNELPLFYRKAFAHKVKELLNHYNLPDRII